LVAWIAGLVFAAFGLFLGHLMPSENVMQFIGPILALLAVMGGIFVPLKDLSSVLQSLALFTPAYGAGTLARAALLGSGVDGGAIVYVVSWTAVFAAGAVWGFRHDTARLTRRRRHCATRRQPASSRSSVPLRAGLAGIPDDR
jgi:ABC-2 type transport system permease protein